MPGSPSPADRPGDLFSALFKVVVWSTLAERAAGLSHQVRLDEHVDVTVEHAVHVTDLLLGAMILGHLVRVQHVAPDLAAKGDLLLGPANLVEPRLLLLELQIVEPGFQNPQRRILVPMLRTLVLARHDDARREM